MKSLMAGHRVGGQPHIDIRFRLIGGCLMGARGPLKLPKLALVQDGKPETAALAVDPVAPLKPAAVTSNRDLSKLWDDIVPELDRAGLVSVADAPAIEMALRHFLLARRASNKVQREGLTQRDVHHGGDKKNTAEPVFRSNSAMFLRYAQQLGMTFAGRARTPLKGGAAGADGDEENPFAPPGG